MRAEHPSQNRNLCAWSTNSGPSEMLLWRLIASGLEKTPQTKDT